MSNWRPPSPLRRELRGAGNVIRIVTGGVTGVALFAVILSSLILLRRFRPDAQVEDIYATIRAERRYAPRAWVSVHEVALNVAVVGSLIWAVTTAALVRARSGAATAVMLMATAAVVIGCSAASLTWGLVRWDQIAKWAVVRGDLLAEGGLWKPAVSDEVRFLIVGGAEVGQGTYRRALLVHLAAPVVAALTLGVSLWLGRRSPAHGTDEPTSA